MNKEQGQANYNLELGDYLPDDGEVTLNLNPQHIRQEFDTIEWEADYLDGDSECKRVYLGTVFSLTPSGKYYLPFACSNVTMAEAAMNELYWAMFNDVGEFYGFSLESGEGDPCDIFATVYREKEA